MLLFVVAYCWGQCCLNRVLFRGPPNGMGHDMTSVRSLRLLGARVNGSCARQGPHVRLDKVLHGFFGM